MGPTRLSFCIIARNEESNLPHCLNSVKGLADELIVVDTGSTDATVRVARDYGAQTFAYDFSVVDFAAARNCAIAHARGQWILMLDADETLDGSGVPGIEKIIASDANDGYFLERRNYSSHPKEFIRDYVVRLFPNRPDYRYRGRVHETIDASILVAGGKLRKTGIGIHHNFISNPEARRRKNHWYIGILEEEIAANPADDSRLDFLATEYHQLGMFDEAAAITERIAVVRPLDARAHLFAGIYHLLYKPDLPRARADLQTALRLRPGYAEAASFLQLLEEKEKQA